jgi:hypothetical protein
MRRVLALSLAASVSIVPAAAAQSATPPGGTTPSGPLFDRQHGVLTRPLRPAPAPRLPVPDRVWVPDQYVQVPGVDGQVSVPGHWEERRSGNQLAVPPLIGHAPDGSTVLFPPVTRSEPPASTQPELGPAAQPAVSDRQAP